MTDHTPADTTKIEKLIRDACSEVVLEDGIGLLEGQALDDYAGWPDS